MATSDEFDPDRPGVGSAVDVAALRRDARTSGPREVAARLADEPDGIVADVLQRVHVPHALAILAELDETRRDRVRRLVEPGLIAQWATNASYPEGSVGRLMETPAGIFSADTSVAEATERLREQVRTTFITYLYVVDVDRSLLGLVVMREALLAKPDTTLGEIMLTEPFTLPPEKSVADAVRDAVARSFPVYPVCDGAGRLLGLVRGADLFEHSLVQIVVQAGSMVGVEREERITTSWRRSLRLRHPWLQLNLVTAIIAGLVVSLFEQTLDRAVVLAAFLPILAGQSGNTGSQAMAVTLRGMTLGDLSLRRPVAVVAKEALLGLLNGVSIGLLAAALMYVYADNTGNDQALTLAFAVLLAMTGSCVASGVFGALVPIALRRLGADPATASSIFLSTATDVVSMGLLLGLASVFLA